MDFHTSTDAEYVLSAGWKPSAGGFNFDLGVIRYGYINQPDHTSIDTVDLKASVSHVFGPATLGAALFYTPDYFGTGKDGAYVEGNVAYKITDKLSASGALGRQTIAAGGDYTTWNAGAGYAFTQNVSADLRYDDTDRHQLGKLYDHHVVFALKASF